MGKCVEVQYRAGDVALPATARLVADSGKSIFLEEHFHRDNKTRLFRWEFLTLRSCTSTSAGCRRPSTLTVHNLLF